jgi:hypothetical protein
MKKITFVLCLVATLISCKKHVETPERTATALLMACVNDKELPNMPKGSTYIEGELNDKYFSISNNPHFNVHCSLQNFLGAGYQKTYTNLSEATGNGFIVSPVDTMSTLNYLLQVSFPTFQGDSIAYLNYFSQFQKGKEFRFRKETGLIKDGLVPETVEIIFHVFQCSQTFSIPNRLSSASDIDQTGSYFRVADVKEYKTVNGQVYKRDVTMEFDVKLGNQGTSLSRIKNGRLFFSY